MRAVAGILPPTQGPSRCGEGQHAARARRRLQHRSDRPRERAARRHGGGPDPRRGDLAV
uniref:hypothetical protein n=1 Tax=Tessaracoccus coleopterorum TaxID=2714950 RepID=UPI001E43D2A7|nr:hypothetical protein [Tessaracoccus coleopterorum]